MNIIELLKENSIQYSDKPIFIEKNATSQKKSDNTLRTLTYGEFYNQVSAMAKALKTAGVNRGSRVLVLTPLSIDLYLILCSLWHVGAGAVIFDPSAGKKHIESCLEAMEVQAFIGSRQAMMLRLINKPIRKIKTPISVKKLKKQAGIPDQFPPSGSKSGSNLTSSLKAVPEAVLPITDVENDTPALTTFTSGSTGIPKAIVRSHGFLLSQHKALRTSLPYEKNDVDLAVLAVFTLVNMVEGITTVLPEDSLKNMEKVDAVRLAKQIETHKVTRITAAPQLVERICLAAEKEKISLDSLRYVNLGGGPVFPDILERISRSVPPESIRVVYGSTEAEPIAELRYPDISDDDKELMRNGDGLLVGSPSGLDLAIIDHQCGPCPDMMTEEDFTGLMRSWGEIAVSGNHVVKSYLDPRQNQSAKIVVTGHDSDNSPVVWHRTGDCGKLDGQGRLWLLGRTSQVPDSPQGPIFPFAIESALRSRYGLKSAVCEVSLPAGSSGSSSEETTSKRILVIEKPQGLSAEKPQDLAKEKKARPQEFSSEGPQGPASEKPVGSQIEPIQAIRELYGSMFDRILEVEKIPMDRRHGSKVDYRELRKVIISKTL